MTEKCKARVTDFSGWHDFPCRNRAKPGMDVCGVHAPKPKKETKWDRREAAFKKLEEVIAPLPEDLRKQIIALAWTICHNS